MEQLTRTHERWPGGPGGDPGLHAACRCDQGAPARGADLVGDGTSDPHTYLGRGNANHIPPYLALVDPWLGETACEPCFGQFDGDDPLDDTLPDGRYPTFVLPATPALKRLNLFS